MTQSTFQEQVATLLEVAMFENWLRFYFIREEDASEYLELEIPEKAMARIKDLYPHLYPLASSLNNKPINFETSRDSVIRHIMAEIDGKTLPQGTAQQILQSSTFQIRLQLFHIWEQLHEDQLDRGFSEFGAWKNLFAQWLETPGAKELAQNLIASSSKNS